MLSLPVKMMLLFQDEPQRNKICLGQGNPGGKDCYFTRKAKQDRQNWEQRLTSCKITDSPDRKLNIAIWLQKVKTAQCNTGKIRMHKKGWEDAEEGTHNDCRE